MKSGLKEKVTKPSYFSCVFRQDLITRCHLSTELKGEREGDQAYMGKCVPDRGKGQYQSLSVELQEISDMFKVNIKVCDGHLW